MTFDDLVEGLPPAARDLAAATRTLLLEILPDADETAEGGDAGFGYGTGYKGLIFVLTPLADGCRIGIYDSVSLDDPAGLLRGRGERHRHVRIADEDALADPALRDLLERAARARRAALGH